jgi:hypothetical protein
MYLLLPSCCGSEDGDLVVGIDPGPDAEAMVHVWKCHTCGTMTVVSAVLMERKTTPR